MCAHYYGVLLGTDRSLESLSLYLVVAWASFPELLKGRKKIHNNNNFLRLLFLDFQKPRTKRTFRLWCYYSILVYPTPQSTIVRVKHQHHLLIHPSVHPSIHPSIHLVSKIWLAGWLWNLSET
ncbi:uncharacterized protein BO72DRAFT_305481 [Aspergillus fijiensis CBS 313.89]|uniref:Uncharacterized protein n=1 Tax=Aspergillus fijiensis CBS 313.89 TaxID=1448319 RepID=A0A8G1S112_9EURO|nr:uncharacterized protein BO72DRAFT_305481 [Aspergillus fijiensis CBS 313.89]RAK80451.1 hypothetical protein BO72DRAFT_305481 [Aspergillus fijiensis CBS 313.89]